LRWRRGGHRRSATVPITVVGATSARRGFVMIFQAFLSATVPNMTAHGTPHKARNADFMGTTASLSAAVEPVGMRETLNWRAFSTAGVASKRRQCAMADCDSPAEIFFEAQEISRVPRWRAPLRRLRRPVRWRACGGPGARARFVYLLAVYILKTLRKYPPPSLDSPYLLRGSIQ
jgi:hypothetical protein